jgi:hypothetical protein
MAYTIETRVEAKRGCGYRRPGGYYLVSDGAGMACGKLPMLLLKCCACGSGIKPSRGWTWIQPAKLFAEATCSRDGCSICPISAQNISQIEKAGLLWIGQAFYESPADFDREAAEMGISRRLAAIPRDFQLGETVVFLAQRKAVADQPAVFRVFKPQRLEYVVGEDDDEEKLERLAKRGVTLVRVVRAEQDAIAQDAIVQETAGKSP